MRLQVLMLVAAAAQAQPSPPPIALSTIPRHVYKVDDGADAHDQAERWYFHLVVGHAADRALTMTTARVSVFAGSREPETIRLREDKLAALRAVSFDKRGVDEGFDVAFHFREPAALAADRVRIVLQLRTPAGGDLASTLDIPIERYQQKTRLSFPLRGKLLSMNGNAVEGGHHEWSQQFAYDVAGLGEHLELLRGDGKQNADYVGWGRPVTAPAAGTIVYARNDVPDNPAPGKLLPTEKLPDPEWAAGGNCVVIDHGNGEFSFLGHLQKGSVLVKKGARVKTGDAIGLLGNSGHSQAPHLHYHLMAGPTLFRSDGLPSRFSNTDVPTPAVGTAFEAR